MRVRTRYLLAVTLVATATLCVDRAAIAAPKVESADSRGIVDRLADGLRRTVATRPVVRSWCPLATATVVAPPVVVRTTAVVPSPGCAAQLPIPPPAV